MPTRRVFPAILAGLILVVAAQSAPAQKPYDDPVLERMRKDIFFLAGPECEGRGVETKGIEKAADYVVDAFKQAGLKPAMKDGSYFQPFTITAGVKLDKPTTLSLSGPGDVTKELKLGTDYNPMGFCPTSKANAGLVFVGYGITAPKLKYDDYEGVDVAGKIVVMLRRIPRYAEKGDKRFDTTAASSDDSEYAPFVYKIENAVAHKVAGIIMVNDTTAAGPRDPLPQFLNHAMGTEPAPFPVMFVKREVLDPLIATGPVRTVVDIETLIDKDLKPRSFEIKGWKAGAEVTVKKTEYKCKNIVGVLEGAGPLADETVVIGAHYDHVGYGTFASLGGKTAEGKIHYGADDNASGTTGLIELARRFGAIKDRQGRRLVFIAFSAEERGLFGSQHYCKNPLFPLDKTTSMINMDMIGRTKPVPTDWLGLAEKKDRLIVYGTGTGDGFDKLVDLTNGKVEFRVTKLAAGSGPSDHDSFYRKKIPVLFLYTGTHGEYHRPTDVPEKINVPGMKKVTDFVQILAEDLTTRDRPKYQVTKDPWRDPTETASPRPMGPKLGVLPDYNYEGEGMRLEGVSPGGAAEKGGLKDGDVIVEIGGKPVKNVGGYMTAMSAQKAGTTVEVIVLRKEKRVPLKVTPE
ncbi:MAG: aminopeptidase [Planctomycetaceae bacterium]|nr:aminopeptidase [Planctomycetaceae bacterium]